MLWVARSPSTHTHTHTHTQKAAAMDDHSRGKDHKGADTQTGWTALPADVVNTILNYVSTARDLSTLAQLNSTWAYGAYARLYANVDHPAALRTLASSERYRNLVSTATIDGSRIAKAHNDNIADWFSNNRDASAVVTPLSGARPLSPVSREDEQNGGSVLEPSWIGPGSPSTQNQHQNQHQHQHNHAALGIASNSGTIDAREEHVGGTGAAGATTLSTASGHISGQIPQQTVEVVEPGDMQATRAISIPQVAAVTQSQGHSSQRRPLSRPLHVNVPSHAGEQRGAASTSTTTTLTSTANAELASTHQMLQQQQQHIRNYNAYSSSEFMEPAAAESHRTQLFLPRRASTDSLPTGNESQLDTGYVSGASQQVYPTNGGVTASGADMEVDSGSSMISAPDMDRNQVSGNGLYQTASLAQFVENYNQNYGVSSLEATPYLDTPNGNRLLDPAALTPASPFTTPEWSRLFSCNNLRTLLLKNLDGEIPSMESLPDLTIRDLVIDFWRVVPPVRSPSRLPSPLRGDAANGGSNQIMDGQMVEIAPPSTIDFEPPTSEEAVIQADAIKAFIAKCPMLTRLTLTSRLEFSVLDNIFNEVDETEYKRFLSRSIQFPGQPCKYYYNYNKSMVANRKMAERADADNIVPLDSRINVSLSTDSLASESISLLDDSSRRPSDATNVNNTSYPMRRAISTKMTRYPSGNNISNLAGRSGLENIQDTGSSLEDDDDLANEVYEYYSSLPFSPVHKMEEVAGFLTVPRNRIFSNPLSQITSLSLGSLKSDIFEPDESISKQTLDNIAKFPNIKRLTIVGCRLPFRYDFRSAFAGQLDVFTVAHCTAVSFLPNDLKRLVIINTHMSQNVFDREMNPETGQRILRELELSFSQLMLPARLPTTLRSIILYECPNVNKLEAAFMSPLLKTLNTRFCRGLGISHLEGAQVPMAIQRKLNSINRQASLSRKNNLSPTTNFLDSSSTVNTGDDTRNELLAFPTGMNNREASLTESNRTQESPDAAVIPTEDELHMFPSSHEYNSDYDDFEPVSPGGTSLRGVQIVTLKSVQSRRSRALGRMNIATMGCNLDDNTSSALRNPSEIVRSGSAMSMGSSANSLDNSSVAPSVSVPTVRANLYHTEASTAQLMASSRLRTSIDVGDGLADDDTLDATDNFDLEENEKLIDGGTLTSFERQLEYYGFKGRWLIESCDVGEAYSSMF